MRATFLLGGCLAILLLAAGVMCQVAVAAGPTLPPTLAATGFDTLEKHAFSPQYPLWTDGAAKRRWIHIPKGKSIDASKPDAWAFPVGTKLWKEFAFDRAIETRFIEKMKDGSWRYATYAWNAEGTAAVLAPDKGVVVPVEARTQAHGASPLPDPLGSPPSRERRTYTIPSRTDCLACHEGGAVPVLGFTALQLSTERDPLALHADAASGLDLKTLVARGLLRNLPPALLQEPPRIPARNPTERATLGYLHGNCGHCHNDGALSGVEFTLAHEVGKPAESMARALASLVGRGSRYRAGAEEAQRVVPGKPEASVLAQRMASSNPLARMPPLGVQRHDTEALALLDRWIRSLENAPCISCPT